MKFGNNTLETDNYEEFELQEPIHKCNWCGEVITKPYTNEMAQSYSDEHFHNRDCEQTFHDNK